MTNSNNLRFKCAAFSNDSNRKDHTLSQPQNQQFLRLEKDCFEPRADVEEF